MTLLIGSHVSMKGKAMLLGSAQEATSYGENVFMIYTGAPQNTRRKPIDELNIEAGRAYMADNDLQQIVVHAPYVVNLGNTLKPKNFPFAVNFLREEVKRADAIGATQIVLHPGAHVGAGAEAAMAQIAKGLNEIITPDQHVHIALETMAGKGTEVGITFEQLREMIDQIELSDKVSVCFDTCHTSDAGYDIKNDFDGVLTTFDKVVGLKRLQVVHLNDSKNECGAHKDRHELLGLGTIGFDALNHVAHHPALAAVPKIMETPWVPVAPDSKTKLAPYGYEVTMLKTQRFNPDIAADVIAQAPFDAYLAR
ncbi:deoxyribonuclease IV [Secundilactobacillus kimchicus]|uniref:Probable endonuclease 4 n=1 Tax=Secundilactobacillus kimchicus JCM 15530 TaxID=1302272 RepID=A0A0R1HSL7_9LACO|nr:deoxyribonuclease IV [Secundilactobacillus kimchicus]KRK49407.1 endonuclease IV [Secundilactobacillus kimchicus JCM 15530]MBT9672953.1 deoxyribonuclease IV [Secundilactobacillus kimchicus]